VKRLFIVLFLQLIIYNYGADSHIMLMLFLCYKIMWMVLRF